MISIEEILGLELEDAERMLDGEEIIVKDISQPDKFHENVKATLRVVRADRKGNTITLFVAGFFDMAKE